MHQDSFAGQVKTASCMYMHVLVKACTVSDVHAQILPNISNHVWCG